jgi:hypothetical protein
MPEIYGPNIYFLTALNIHAVFHWISTISLLHRYQHLEEHTHLVFMVEMSTPNGCHAPGNLNMNLRHSENLKYCRL